MHPEIRSEKEARCPKCGMKLVPEGRSQAAHNAGAEENGYGRLLIIIGIILLATFAIALNDLQHGTFTMQNTITNFMAGFFLAFSGFKLMDIKGFAEGYYMYDLLASRVFQYGYIYPFIELAFGISFLTGFNIRTTEILEVIIMIFSGLGVVLEMRKKRKIKCACLGTIIKVPLGTVTLIEDFGMAALGIILLFVL